MKLSRLDQLVLTILTILMVVYLVIPREVKGDFESDYQGFLQTYESYRSANSKYITTRNQYLTFKTLTSKNDALNAGKDFVKVRSDVLLSYISLLRGRNTDSNYALLLDAEQNFIRDNQQKIPGIASLDDLVDVSHEIEQRHVPFQVTTRKIVDTVLINKVGTLELNYLQLETQAKQLIQTLKTQGKDVAVLERWLLDARNKIQLTEQKAASIRDQIATLNSPNLDDLSNSSGKIQAGIFEANQYLLEATNYMNELAKAIIYGNY